MEARVLQPQHGRAYGVLRAEQQAEAIAGHDAPELVVERDLLIAQPERQIERYLAFGTAIWGAFDGQVMVGTLAVRLQFSNCRLPYLWMWGLYVRPSYRGTPASRVLMETAFRWCEHQPASQRVFACYRADNLRARRFCQRYGFDVTDGSGALGGILLPPDTLLVERQRGD